jgi:hypothetical protein
MAYERHTKLNEQHRFMYVLLTHKDYTGYTQKTAPISCNLKYSTHGPTLSHYALQPNGCK